MQGIAVDEIANKPPIRRFNRRVQTIFVTVCIFVFLIGIYLLGNSMGGELIQANFSQKGLAPSWEHPFGTDMLGRDMLARTIKDFRSALL